MRKATHQGTLPIGDLELRCFVLDDGTRVISGRTMTQAIGMKGRGQGVARIPAHKTLKPFISEDLALAIANPVEFAGKGGAVTIHHGYEATVLLGICEAILNARDNDVLKTEQEIRYAKFCDILMRAFARVGLIALIDEATGYQAERARNALYKVLEAYIAKELLPWTKRFPDEFYEQMFRLRGWQYNPFSVKRPQVVGMLTNKVVYKRLPPGVLDELKHKNPSVNGRRRYKHHQFLSENIGNPHLEKHLASVIALMRASSNWRAFEKLLERAFPISDAKQLEFFEEDSDSNDLD